MLTRILPERVIICFDLSSDKSTITLTRSRTNKNVMKRVDYLKQFICQFISGKNLMNKDHEFSLCLLTTEAIWYQSFTSDTKRLFDMVESITPTEEYNKFDISTLFLCLSENILPLSSDYVYRVIFFYSRNVNPQWGEGKSFHQQLTRMPNFFFDFCFCISGNDRKLLQVSHPLGLTLSPSHLDNLPLLPHWSYHIF
eukprot:TRINITY_DN4691_c0_g1_i2.p1 TRINITY_DN4691_c0_g1~~TRINITY_DN4691_c0_g1_i2.p1  ORF type:complete len:197 (-),score=27.26 TRINITY_DN4691_c0_g1_i2:857-1447(-)